MTEQPPPPPSEATLLLARRIVRLAVTANLAKLTPADIEGEIVDLAQLLEAAIADRVAIALCTLAFSVTPKGKG